MAVNTAYYGFWGEMRKKFMETYRPGEYGILLDAGKEEEYLREFNAEYQAKADEQLPRLLERLGVTEALKEHDPMEWIARYNQARDALIEMLRAEIEEQGDEYRETEIETNEEDNGPELLPNAEKRLIGIK